MQWLLLAAVVVCFTGCATSPLSSSSSSSSSAAPPAVNLSGFPPAFRAGYSDGCASVNAARRRDEPRFKSDASYAQGWRYGYDVCRRRQ
jgi:hypothetical protein